MTTIAFISLCISCFTLGVFICLGCLTVGEWYSNFKEKREKKKALKERKTAEELATIIAFNICLKQNMEELKEKLQKDDDNKGDK